MSQRIFLNFNPIIDIIYIFFYIDKARHCDKYGQLWFGAKSQTLGSLVPTTLTGTATYNSQQTDVCSRVWQSLNA